MIFKVWLFVPSRDRPRNCFAAAYRQTSVMISKDMIHTVYRVDISGVSEFSCLRRVHPASSGSRACALTLPYTKRGTAAILSFGGPEITFEHEYGDSSPRKRESRHAISRAKFENFSGSQNYKISITLRMYPTGFCAQSFYKYSFFS